MLRWPIPIPGMQHVTCSKNCRILKAPWPTWETKKEVGTQTKTAVTSPWLEILVAWFLDTSSVLVTSETSQLGVIFSWGQIELRGVIALTCFPSSDFALFIGMSIQASALYVGVVPEICLSSGIIKHGVLENWPFIIYRWFSHWNSHSVGGFSTARLD